MKKLIIAALACVLLLGACAAPQPSLPAGSPSTNGGSDSGTTSVSYRASLEPQPISPQSSSFVGGVNTFGTEAAQLLLREDQNLAISPVSIELAMLMARIGAVGATKDEITAALQMNGISDEELIAACRSLMWRANTGGMEAANSIWLRDGYTYTDDFTKTCTQDFMADAMPLVIPGAKDSINAWVEEKTHEKIKDLIAQELSPETEAVLVNALYFLGDWQTPFEAESTYDQDFHTPGGDVTASFMHDTRDEYYYDGDGYTLISLLFKTGKDEGVYSMAFVLPDEGNSVADALAALQSAGFSNVVRSLETQHAEIALPKFEYTYDVSLVSVLRQLGINLAFDPNNADFSGMTEEANDLFISDVVHKCYIRVDETGAEAAAATAVDFATTAMPVDNKTFVADRPFAFMIYSLEDGIISFLGTINDPTK